MQRMILILTISIAVLAAYASYTGLFSDDGNGPSTVTSVRGEEIKLHGKGPYRHMSATVAPQGIAQDAITLFAAIPILLISFYFYQKGSVKGLLIFTGTAGYFLVTYLFFTMMAMFNHLFLVWVILLSMSFFLFILLGNQVLNSSIKFNHFPYHLCGGFLIFNSVAIGMLWLSIVLPHLIQGTIPPETEHYTTLVVQALDLAILLPAAFIAGILCWRKEYKGALYVMVYLVFLSILMTALTAKVIAMMNLGENVFPVIIIIPFFNVLSISCAWASLRGIKSSLPG